MRPSFQFSIGAIMFWIGVIAVVLTIAPEVRHLKSFLIGMTIVVLALAVTSRKQVRLALGRTRKGASDASAKRAPDSRHLSSDFNDAGRLAGRHTLSPRRRARWHSM